MKRETIPNTTALITATFLLTGTEFLARAGGGGYGSGGYSGRHYGSSDEFDLTVLVVVTVLILAGGVFSIWYEGHRVKIKSAMVTEALSKAATIDTTWDPERLDDYLRGYFHQAQKLWTARDYDGLKEHLHPSLYPDWELKLRMMKSRSIRNIVKDVEIKSIEYVDMKNFKDDERDEFTVRFEATCKNHKVNEYTGKILDHGDSYFVEYWTMERESRKWVLREIAQTDKVNLTRDSIVDEELGTHWLKSA
jgi:hypothetical protein